MSLEVLIGLMIFLFGISWGSFLNVWIYRIPLGRSVAGGRSGCMTCQHTLGPLDLVPVFSFLFLRGRCRYCKTKLSWQYPAVELIVGALFLLSYVLFGINPYLLLISAFLITVNVVIAKIDWDTSLIPNLISYPSILIAGVLSFFHGTFPVHKEFLSGISTYEQVVPSPTTAEAWIGGIAFFSVFLILYFVSNGGMGMGDAKWVLFIGLMFGWQLGILALFLGTFLSSVFSLSILALFGKKIKELPNYEVSIHDETEEAHVHKIYGISIINGKPAVVLGPFLAIGMLIVWFFGFPIMEWWFSL